MVAYVYKAVKQRHPVMDYYHVDLLAKSQKNIFQWMEWNDCNVEILLQLFLSLIAQSTWSNLKKNISADVAQWVEIDADWEFAKVNHLKKIPFIYPFNHIKAGHFYL